MLSIMDDYKARRIAQEILQQHNKHIAVRGTLGIIMGTVKSGHLEASEAITLVTTLRERFTKSAREPKIGHLSDVATSGCMGYSIGIQPDDTGD
jgi:hypothetical protein